MNKTTRPENKMLITDYFCSFEQAVCLKELGLKQSAKYSYAYDLLNERWDISILQVEALDLLAQSHKDTPKIVRVGRKLESVPHDGVFPDYYSAWTSDELFQILPVNTSLSKGGKEYHCRFWTGNFAGMVLRETPTTTHHTESHATPVIALAAMAVYLLKLGFIKPDNF